MPWYKLMFVTPAGRQLLFAIFLYMLGFGLIWLVSWKVMVGVFCVLWANNLSR